MEIVIVICLLILIALLVQDKIVNKKSSERKPIQGKSNPKLPDIMGQPRLKRSFSVPNNRLRKGTRRANEKSEKITVSKLNNTFSSAKPQ